MFCFLPSFVVYSVSESESDFCDTLVRVYATLSLSHDYSYSQILAKLVNIKPINHQLSRCEHTARNLL